MILCAEDVHCNRSDQRLVRLSVRLALCTSCRHYMTTLPTTTAATAVSLTARWLSTPWRSRRTAAVVSRVRGRAASVSDGREEELGG